MTTSMEIIVNGTAADSSSRTGPDPVIEVSGRIVRKAVIKDQEWLSEQIYGDPANLLQSIINSPIRVDLFCFSQKLPETSPRYPFPIEWDNVAAIETARFDHWWDHLPQEARKNSRRATRRGVEIREFTLSDEMIHGIVSIYNETPFRQGRPFTHFGKDFATVKREISTFADASTFLGAFHQGELIGFIKLIRSDSLVGIMHIVSKNRHYDKRPSNALITKAAELCRDRGISHLVYGKYTYGNKINNPLTEFKRRMGFEKIAVPSYFVPITPRGGIFLRLKLHRGLIGILPPKAVELLLSIRSKLFQNGWLPTQAPKPAAIEAGPEN